MGKRRSIGVVLGSWRRERKLSQGEAARLVGVRQCTWSRWERGLIVPSGEHLRQIVKASGVSAADLIESLPASV